MLAQLGDAASAHFWGIAVVAFLAGIGFETLFPDRETTFPALRWASNFLLYAACIALAALVTGAQPLSAVMHLGFPGPFDVIDATGGDATLLIAGILSLDLFIYWLHRLEHSVFLLWRFHSVHHSDLEFDASTAIRHHPLEYAVTTVLVSLVFGVLGLPVWVFAVYGVVFFLSALFQHLNLRMPGGLEQGLQRALVGPAMHRVHHSVDARYFNSNFGSVFSIWDRMFGTYQGLSGVERDFIAVGVAVPTEMVTHLWSPWILPFILPRGTGTATEPYAARAECEPTLSGASMSRVRLAPGELRQALQHKEGESR